MAFSFDILRIKLMRRRKFCSFLLEFGENHYIPYFHAYFSSD